MLLPTNFSLLATLEDSAYNLQFEHRIVLPVFDKLGDVDTFRFILQEVS